MAKNKVYLVIHRMDNDEVQVQPFTTKAKANAYFRQILTDYAEQGYELNTKAKTDAELYEATDGKVTLHIQDAQLDFERN